MSLTHLWGQPLWKALSRGSGEITSSGKRVCMQEVASEVQSPPLLGTQVTRTFPIASVLKVNMFLPPHIVYWGVI